jgi:hypothetical protein
MIVGLGLTVVAFAVAAGKSLQRPVSEAIRNV